MITIKISSIKKDWHSGWDIEHQDVFEVSKAQAEQIRDDIDNQIRNEKENAKKQKDIEIERLEKRLALLKTSQ